MLSHERTEAVPEVGVAGKGSDGISHSLFHRTIASSGRLP